MERNAQDQPGPAQVFYTTPEPELLTRFPLALVPGFLVPLALLVHFVSLWQLRPGRPGEPRVSES